jgi:hypothetical protein
VSLDRATDPTRARPVTRLRQHAGD